MIQGTSSNVGKSLLATALCRIFRQDGYRVAPFKSQNMSLNSYVTERGAEIGRAQGVQAEASGIAADATMNPVLLKPSGEKSAQIIVMGKPLSNAEAIEYREHYVEKLWPVALTALKELLATYDIVVIEGAGSPAEVNLRDRDIANMRVALAVAAPVLLVGDIDRGGVLASFVGTLELLSPDERERVAGLVINKFRGDETLLQPALDFLEEKTGKKVVGVIPYIHERLIDDEDSVALEERLARVRREADTGDEAGDDAREELIEIAIIALPRISNFTDFDPFEREEKVRVRYVCGGEKIGTPDVVVIPGSKNTIGDLEYLRQQGLDREIIDFANRGGIVVGICGGYQMLGKTVSDEAGIESAAPATVAGLDLLDLVTRFGPVKTVERIAATVDGKVLFGGVLDGAAVEGYEIHMGQSLIGSGARPWLRIERRGGRSVDEWEGAINPAGNVFGTYVHDLFHNGAFRTAWLTQVRLRRHGRTRIEDDGGKDSWTDAETGARSYSGLNALELRERNYDQLAAIVRKSIDLRFIYRAMGL